MCAERAPRRFPATDGTNLHPALAARAEQTAALIARRLADTELVDDAARRSAERARFPYQWGGVPLYAGHTGQALVFHTASRVLADDAERWRARSRACLREATGRTHRMPLREPGVGYGTAGLTLAVAECAAVQPGYRALSRRLLARLAEQVLRQPSPRTPDGVDRGAFDVVQGAAGVLGHLVGVPQPDSALRAAIERLTDDLVWLCASADGGRRRWHVAPKFFNLPIDYERFPHGYLDLGLAHGVPGPLAALSRAWCAGYRRPGMYDAIRGTADDLMELSIQDRWGRNWPRILPLDEAGEPGEPLPPMGRTAWCYGAPGVCSALLDAADALDDAELRTVAYDGLHGELNRLRDGHSYVDAATLCHGLSGVLLIAEKFARHTPDQRSVAAVTELAERVLAYCDPGLPLIVQEIHVHAPDVRLDSPGLLDGAAGVALALWSIARPDCSGWQRALLID